VRSGEVSNSPEHLGLGVVFNDRIASHWEFHIVSHSITSEFREY